MSVRPIHMRRAGFLAFLHQAMTHASYGRPIYYAWMILLTCVTLVGINAWANQIVSGMHITGMSDHVTWGLYIANFTFFDGIAAAAVAMVVPAYLYRDREMHDVVIVGMLLAIAAIIICLFSVTVDLGRPERFWHMVPGIGRFNWPISMLTWDVIVLDVYLALNVWICSYLLWCRWRAKEPTKALYLPFVFISIIWAVSIQAVIAFLYSGLGGRPFWNSALLAPRFLASAFVAGPAFIIITMLLLQRLGSYPFGDKPIALLVRVVRFTALINLFMLAAEIFTALYSGSAHAASLHYLLFGLHGHDALVPWVWSAITLNVVATGMFLWPGLLRRPGLLGAACIMAFVGIWIEKSMGLIIPGFIPSSLHEMVEYVPSTVEWKITLGITAGGLLLFTVMLKVALPLLSGWTPGLSVGVQSLDDQHHHMFTRLNTLVAAIRAGRGAEELNKTMGFLEQDVREHFDEEETLMAEVGFPGLERHQRLHAGFYDELETVRAAFDRPDADRDLLAERLHLFLREWLTNHIRVEDRAYAAYLQEQHPERLDKLPI